MQHNLTDRHVICDTHNHDGRDNRGHEQRSPVGRFDHRGWREECNALGCKTDTGISLDAFTNVLYGSEHHPVTGPLAWRALWHGVKQHGLERDIER